MSDTLMTIIGIFIAVILMFILPLTIMANKNDEIAQTVVQVAVSDFVDKVTKQGVITENDYDTLIQKISATGNTFDVQIEAQIIDDNPRRATTAISSSQTGEYKYYSVYTNTILEKIRDDGEYELKKDDYIIVNVKNTNVTMATQFKNMFYKLAGKDTYSIGSSSSSIVVNSNRNIEKAIGVSMPNRPAVEEKTIRVKAEVNTSTNIEKDVCMVVILDCDVRSIPYHNGHTTSVGSGEASVSSIIETIGDKGEVYFILTSNPDQVYNKEEILQIANSTGVGREYKASLKTAFNFIKDKSKPRCVVFLSFTPDEAATDGTALLLNTYKDYYDCFFTMLCCDFFYEYVGEFRGRQAEFAWFTNYPKEVGGHIYGDPMDSSNLYSLHVKFNKVIDTAKWMRKSIIQEDHYLREEDITTSDLKIYLKDLDITQEMSIIVNNTDVKKIGSDIPEYVVYFDSTKNSYVLDLKIIKEILNMSDEAWNKANIEFDYIAIV